MRVKIGRLCMVLGALLVAGALALFLYNQREQAAAEEASQAVMPELVEAINTRVLENTEPKEQAAPNAPIPEMTEVKINGYYYIGFIGIPALELELPVMTDWDYKKLNIAPCRYYGNLYGDNLVVMAHNYPNHFGKLSELTMGDTVTFTDMNGETFTFEVAAIEVLVPEAVEEMIAGEYDLTLYTCTYGGQSRVTVRCDRVQE